jgi:hypothetical protein
MANIYTVRPISQSIPIVTISGEDIIPIVDVTNTSQTPGGTTSIMTVNQFQSYLGVAATGSNKQSCQVISVANLSATYANGEAGVGATLTNNSSQVALHIDGVTLSVNNRVLVAGQTSTFENGIYVVTVVGSGATNWVLTRSNDYNGSASGIISQGDLIGITLGAVYAESLWLQTQTGPFIVGTTSIAFSTKSNFQFHAGDIITSDYNASYSDYFISVDTTSNPVIVTLPAVFNNNGQGFVIKDVGGNAASNHITIDTADRSNIDFTSTAIISNNGGALQVYVFNSQYYIY